ncbi:disulfide bond formation protein B [Amantichitinum ursilacus]|uniref:Disulfide bond formation protein B n=1 Tax=Amantichitinum ursilacus TaxID=857265 RepID=A0A0N0XIA4_9NEIS|nr:disulfide bond formation protein B [Amantichitinum ursilacus]KPC52657.1 Disulfide bond formation protein B [Amantichitinum ursilacus]
MVKWRLGFLGLALVCAGCMAYALYEQYYEFLSPCPLCIFQRIVIITFGVLSLLAALLPARGSRFWPVVLTLVGLSGMGVAGRHIYIQYFMDTSKLASCGPGLEMMLQKQPWLEVFRAVLVGHGECAVIDWKFLGLSMPCWTFILFVALTVGAWLVWKCQGKRK